MKYIPGASFVVRPRNTAPRSITVVGKPVVKASSYGKFKPQNRYTLQKIKKIDSGIEYTFINNTTNEILVNVYSETAKADEQLDGLIN